MNILLFVLVLACCWVPTPLVSSTSLVSSSPVSPPKIVFTKKELKIGDKTLYVEIADTQEKRSQGLMYRKKLPSNAGMLFIFDKESIQNFWMKNTFIDLTIGFFDKSRVLIDMQDMDGVKSILQKDIPRASSKFPAKFALEVNKGWFKKNGIKLGQKFSLK